MKRLASLVIDQTENNREALDQARENANALSSIQATSTIMRMITDGGYLDDLTGEPLPPSAADSTASQTISQTWNEICRNEEDVEVDGVEIKRMTAVTLELQANFTGAPGPRSVRMRLLFNNSDSPGC